MKRFLNWLADRISPQEASQKISRNRPGSLSRSGQYTTPAAKPAAPKNADSDTVEFDATVTGKIDSVGPGKNVLRRPGNARDDTGAHESLSLVDGTTNNEPDDADGIDPYNTGQFDRSRNWDKRFRKD